MSSQVFSNSLARYQPFKRTNKYSRVSNILLIGDGSEHLLSFDVSNDQVGTIPSDGYIVYNGLNDIGVLAEPKTKVAGGMYEGTTFTILESGMYVFNGVFSFSSDLSAGGPTTITTFSLRVLDIDDSTSRTVTVTGRPSISNTRVNAPLSTMQYLYAGQKIRFHYNCYVTNGGTLYSVISPTDFIKSYVEFGRL